jgi:Tfp pilus assembly protein PilN
MSRPRLELDYVVPPRRSLWLGLLLLAIALGVAADLIARFSAARDERSRIEATQGLLNTERPAAKPVAVPVERLDEQIKAAEATVRQLTLPWATLIEVLENATTPDVAVLQVQPEAQQRLLRLTAEARNQKAMLLYMRKLADSNALEDVHLVNHQVQNDDPQKPLQFSAQATIKVTP